MAIAAMPQLVEGQAAQLDVGESLPCRVIGFTGPDVVLALEALPDEPIELGAEAYLLLQTDGQLQAMRGRLGPPSGTEVVLHVTDDIRLGQRRLFSRAPVGLPLRVRATDGGEEWSTVTTDVSAGGVGLSREECSAGDGPLELRIQVAGHEIAAEARVVRASATELGLQFERIDDGDRLLLASIALAYHRPR